jgi:hypothetical protein
VPNHIKGTIGGELASAHKVVDAVEAAYGRGDGRRSSANARTPGGFYFNAKYAKMHLP